MQGPPSAHVARRWSEHPTEEAPLDVPPEMAFRNVEATDDLKRRILDGISDLEEVHDHVVSCRVMVEETDPARNAGKLNHVRIEVSVPHHQVVVNRDPPAHPASQDLRQAVKEAFRKARRRLREVKAKQRGDVKVHDLPPHGRVVRLLTDDTGVRFGFLHSRDGRAIYFHENALVDLDYDDLEVGTEVRFAEERGKEGPQASTVAPLDPDSIGPAREEEVPLREI